jgi:DNA-binding XRE family transcriptional regulator
MTIPPTPPTPTPPTTASTPAPAKASPAKKASPKASAKRNTKKDDKERATRASTFSARLREARMAVGYSHGDAANALGVTREGYGRLERGRVMPRADVLLRVAKLFNVSTDWLLGLID